MQEIGKVSVDMLFCLIVSFLVIQATNASNHNREFTNTLSAESARISASHR